MQCYTSQARQYLTSQTRQCHTSQTRQCHTEDNKPGNATHHKPVNATHHKPGNATYHKPGNATTWFTNQTEQKRCNEDHNPGNATLQTRPCYKDDHNPGNVTSHKLMSWNQGRKRLTLTAERYTVEFCMVANFKVILWCIWNHCIADSINLHNSKAVNLLRIPSKTMSKYYFSNVIYFYQKVWDWKILSLYNKTTSE